MLTLSCPRCRLHHNCICQLQPNLTTDIQLELLLHSNEFKRRTNTGLLLRDSIAANVHQWQRKPPCAELTQQIAACPDQFALVYPSEDAICLSEAQDVKHFIILDGTWQEAAKIYRQSPYLHHLPKITLKPQQASAYCLRANQAEGNLCTYEVAIQLCKELGLIKEANQLEAFWLSYLQVFEADRSGYQFKG
ncbi:tRNA-uridine aminocarboxypropyltransferase [Paraferrimonas sp. SM1919]|uniref:tRNA-uridine aminocarboxypropyltransferase n=1 Tax=Paraferrimonas sp. SM1919 TaxID=2662263 RepID=UPI0013D49DE9|nr:tRNA-uridine aminocarboxypropyltransferase [Paraferrimonas sp. SM1919]